MLQDLIPRKSYIEQNGESYFYDNYRQKWLSLKRKNVSFSINHENARSNRWLCYSGIPSNLTGYQANFNYVIVAADAFSNSSSVGSFQICVENEIIASLDFTSEYRKASLLDIPFLKNNKLSVKLSGMFDYPIVNIELANLLGG